MAPTCTSSVWVPVDSEMNDLIHPAIAQVKAGRAAEGGRLIEQAANGLMSRGASAVILACTETPVALDAIQSSLRPRCIHSTGALARRRVGWWSLHGKLQ